MRLVFTANRPIVSAFNQTVELVIGARSAAPTFRRYGTQTRSKDGGRYSELDRIERRHSISTTRIYDGTIAPAPGIVTVQAFEEFLQSTANFESFIWDQYSREAGFADRPITVINRSSSVSFRRIMRTRYFRASFQVEQV